MPAALIFPETNHLMTRKVRRSVFGKMDKNILKAGCPHPEQLEEPRHPEEGRASP